MNEKKKYIISGVFLIACLAFSSQLAASVFYPESDLEIVLSGDSVFNYDNYIVPEDVKVTYSAPDYSKIEISSSGDIVIHGVIELISQESEFSLITSNGSISIFGSILLDDSSLNLEVADGQMDSIVLDSRLTITDRVLDSRLTITDRVDLKQDATIVFTDGSNLSLTTIPLPMTFWLFVSALFSFVGLQPRKPVVFDNPE